MGGVLSMQIMEANDKLFNDLVDMLAEFFEAKEPHEEKEIKDNILKLISGKLFLYKGYTIVEDYDRNPYKKEPEFMFYPTNQGIQHDGDLDGDTLVYCGNCEWAQSKEEAMDEIDEAIAVEEAIETMDEKLGEMNHLKEPQDER